MKWDRATLQYIFNSSQIPLQSFYASLFQSFIAKSLLKQGQQLHAHLALRALIPTPFLAAKMVAMYASSGDIHSASRVFHSAPALSTLLFNSIIRASTHYKLSHLTLNLYHQMHSLGFHPDYFTYPFVLKSVSDLCFLPLGKCIHGFTFKDALNRDAYIGTSLIDMYVKCSQLNDARKVFDEMLVRDVSSWNALIAGYMRDGAVTSAHRLFDEMPTKNIVSWTTMISGYSQNAFPQNALQLFDEMCCDDSETKPNWVTIISILPVCAHSSALETGRRIHRVAEKRGLDSHPSVKTALMGMYSKCGSLPDAQQCFDSIKPNARNLVAWNTMITAYASHGFGTDAVRTFEEMIKSGISPDGITFTGLLSGCSHSGLVDIGLRYFDMMSSIHFIEKRHEHYACVVDLLGRAGRLTEACQLIHQMPMPAEASIWGSLLNAGRRHRNLEISELAAKKLFDLEPENSGNYVILSNIYADAGMWKEVKDLRALQKSQNVKKNPGCSWIELDRKAHLFLGGDVSHPQTKEIYAFLEELHEKMREAGYVPDTNFALHDVSEEEKEHSLSTHSEKLAVVFGLLNAGPGTIIRVTKNLRICGDCHTAMKFVSRMYEREIIVRDVNRFHCFKDGLCSCRDYW